VQTLVWETCFTAVEPESQGPVQGSVSEIEMSPRRATAVVKMLRGGAVTVGCQRGEDELVVLVTEGFLVVWLEVSMGMLTEDESAGLVSRPTVKSTRAREPKARAEKRIPKK
jgi:hypothetical protein